MGHKSEYRRGLWNLVGICYTKGTMLDVSRFCWRSCASRWFGVRGCMPNGNNTLRRILFQPRCLVCKRFSGQSYWPEMSAWASGLVHKKPYLVWEACKLHPKTWECRSTPPTTWPRVMWLVQVEPKPQKKFTRQYNWRTLERKRRTRKLRIIISCKPEMRLEWIET